MCQGTKSRMSCGHFHLNFHERCEAWCNEPQVQLIMHRDEQCGHCVARSEVDVSRTHHQKYFNKEKQRFMAAYHSYCVDGQQEVLVSLREEVIRANREMRALREEFPGLKHLEYQLDGIRRELADMKAMIQVQMRLVEEEGGMEELFVINERRSSLMRHRDLAVKKHGGVPQHVRESFDSQMERLLEDQIVLMKRCPQLTKLNCMERRLEHLESREKRLSSHDYLERLDSIRARQFAFEVEEKRMAKERLRPLRSIGSRMRQQAMEEKAEVKEARRAGRAVAYREPDR
ncbi:hypothetical protein QBC40DRAFT_320748 [Triangularia verruculosa]|uniref:Uncharacterized protein n=1 Tax=Triangularia verruculosa TaxID=2587418 RepID=A0AAN6XM51_9PEZI|nr:hypothetical protein QBC40DRAFT_320748 [Triangularia verruculosa]